MSTAPSGWQNPKVSWQPADVVSASDLVRIESNINAIEQGARTLDPSQAPTGNQGTLRQILDWVTNRIQAITGTTNWWDAPAATIATIWSKFNASSGHKHTGGANDAPPIPLSGIDSAAKTSAGGTEANRLAVTDGGGAVGRANALRDGGGTYRTATSPGGTQANSVAVTDSSGRVGDSARLGGVPASSYARRNANETWTGRPTFAAGVQIGDGNADLIDVFGLLVPLGTHTKQVTAWDSTFPAKPRTIQIKDGSTVMATIEVTSRNSEGKATQITITQGARTRTWTISWTAGKEWPDSVTVS